MYKNMFILCDINGYLSEIQQIIDSNRKRRKNVHGRQNGGKKYRVD